MKYLKFEAQIYKLNKDENTIEGWIVDEANDDFISRYDGAWLNNPDTYYTAVDAVDFWLTIDGFKEITEDEYNSLEKKFEEFERYQENFYSKLEDFKNIVKHGEDI